MNRSILIGVVAGIGIGVAGGVAAYTFMGKDAEVTGQPSAVAAVHEECWDEEVTVQGDPVDRHRIAGTAGGAIVGGAVGRDIGDRDITTAAGAAVGAVIGRRVQQEIQENRAEGRSTTTIQQRCAPAVAP
jgi:uncharacterized protein YcfJ